MSRASTPRTGGSSRPLRADAKRNYDLLIRTADAAFTQHGADASLEDIARRAGVGIGTLYRHFPTRDALLAAVLGDSFRAIIQYAEDLRDHPSPGTALTLWLEALVDHTATYRGLTESLASSFACEEPAEGGLRRSCEQTTEAFLQLLVRAQEAGEIRADAEVKDVMMIANAVAWAAEQDPADAGCSKRMLRIFLDGLRVTPPAEPRSKSARSAPLAR